MRKLRSLHKNSCFYCNEAGTPSERSHRHRQSVGLCLHFVCQGRREGESSLDLRGAFTEIESGLIDSGHYDEALSLSRQPDAM